MVKQTERRIFLIPLIGQGEILQCDMPVLPDQSRGRYNWQRTWPRVPRFSEKIVLTRRFKGIQRLNLLRVE